MAGPLGEGNLRAVENLKESREILRFGIGLFTGLAVLEAEGQPGGLTDILAVVLAQTGCDFRYYKKSTTLRRIERRMGLHRLADLAQYCGLLQRDAGH